MNTQTTYKEATQVATFTELKQAINSKSHRKEKHYIGGYLVIADRKEIIDVRLYRASTTYYCCIWIHTDNKHGNGSGRAGGYGYDKKSAAIGAAIDSMGIKLELNISGIGETAERLALIAIGVTLGYKSADIDIYNIHA